MPLLGQGDSLRKYQYFLDDPVDLFNKIKRDVLFIHQYVQLFEKDYHRGVYQPDKYHQFPRVQICILLFIFARKKGPRNLYVGHSANPFLHLWKIYFLQSVNRTLTVRDAETVLTISDKDMCLLLNYFYCYGQCMLLSQ
jgi:hypothetical protein